MVRPCSTQVLAFWSNTAQNGVVNANTIESIGAQYNSLILERSIVDPSAVDERFPQFFPSSELTRRWTNPGTAPTFVYRYDLAPLSNLYIAYVRGGFGFQDDGQGVGGLLGDAFSLRDDEQLFVKLSYRFEI